MFSIFTSRYLMDYPPEPMFSLKHNKYTLYITNNV